MSGDNATDSRRIRLLQALSTHAGITEYANYVGGLVGYNGTKGSVTWDQYGTPTLGAILYGDTFVGGLAGYNDGNAAIINTSGKPLTIRGQIVADGDAVGGMIGLNTAPVLPTATVAATRVEGVHFVGGVIGANMPVGSFTVQDTLGKAGALTTTVTAGRVRADGVAGGIIGYNRLLAALPQDVTHAAMLPTFSDDNVLIDSTAVASSEAAVCLENFTNTFNLEANAYVGGILGYNDAATNLTIRNAVNGSSSNALAVGGLSMGTDDTAHRLYQGVKLLSLNQNYEFGETRGYLAGGIIGFAAQKYHAGKLYELRQHCPRLRGGWPDRLERRHDQRRHDLRFAGQPAGGLPVPGRHRGRQHPQHRQRGPGSGRCAARQSGHRQYRGHQHERRGGHV